jgi:hypothetical protein
LLIIAIGLAVSRFINLLFRLKVNTRAFNNAVLKLMSEGNLDRAVKLCDAAPSALYPRGMKGALLALQSGQTDPVALTRSFNEALKSQKMDQPDSYAMPSSEAMQFPALKKMLAKIQRGVYAALVLAAAGAALHFISISQAPHEYFYGPAGAVLFVGVLSLKETFGIVRQTRIEFERFCRAAQGGGSFEE